MEKKESELFCSKWLPSWTGGAENVDKLLSFYAKNAFYRDPVVTDGIRGLDNLETYFTKLLSRNPAWKWECEEVFPTEKGFTLKWKAIIPSKTAHVQLFGLDIVEIENGLISRNEVFFDRSPLLGV